MSSRQHQPVLGLGSALREMKFRFFPNGTSDPTFSAIECPGVASIARSGVGAFLVTLRDSYCQLRGARADLAKAAATPNWAQVGTIANVGSATPMTIVVRTVDGSGAGVDKSEAKRS